jgi:hypothetical protein
MPKHKSLLVGSRWVNAHRARKCYHSPEHVISKGDHVLEVRVKLGWQGYCEVCGREMIHVALGDLQNLRDNRAS